MIGTAPDMTVCGEKLLASDAPVWRILHKATFETQLSNSTVLQLCYTTIPY